MDSRSINSAATFFKNMNKNFINKQMSQDENNMLLNMKR